MPTTESLAEITSSSVSQAVWETVEANWDDPAVHEAFLQACLEEGLLAFAAQKYRAQRDSEEINRRELSETQLQKVTGLALAQLTAVKSHPPDHRRIVTVLSVLVSLALIVACAYLMTL